MQGVTEPYRAVAQISEDTVIEVLYLSINKEGRPAISGNMCMDTSSVMREEHADRVASSKATMVHSVIQPTWCNPLSWY